MTASGVHKLAVVIAQGSPAQVESATALLADLHANPTNVNAMNNADELFDAFLHDPHLTRFESGTTTSN